MALASHGWNVTCVDISATAVEQANKRVDDMNLDFRDRFVCLSVCELFDRCCFSRIHFVNGDFGDHVSEQGYDLIVDYTFFCAIHPSRRTWWAENMARLLNRDNEDARLMTIMFPIFPDWDANKGPPYPVNLERYQAVLDEHFELVSCEDCEFSLGPRNGHEMVAFWKLRR